MRLFNRDIMCSLVFSACAFLGSTASANVVMNAQRLAPPDNVPGGSAYFSPTVSGDWIAVVGRLSSFEGDGRVFVFHRDNGHWSYFQSITPPDDGSCVDSLVFGANALFVGCNTAIDYQIEAAVGTVSVYTLAGQQWQLAQTIKSATGYMGGGGFGTSLAVSGDRLFVGYPGFVPAPSSAAYGDVEVFDISQIPATFVSQITPANPVSFSGFGSSLAAVPGQLAVGANTQSLSGVGDGVGAVYTFTYAASTGDWIEGSPVSSAAPSAYDNFPTALVFQENQLVAGSATSDRLSKGGPLGVTFTYSSVVGGMSLNDALYPQELVGNTMFGQALASVGCALFVAEPNVDTGGRVHMYTSFYGNWQHTSAFVSPDIQDGDGFGTSMATDGQTLVVGASETNRVPTTMGSIYVFTNPPSDQVFAEGSED